MNVLLVVDRNWWNRKCPPFWPDQAVALYNHPNIKLKVSGNNWPDWRRDRVLKRNVNAVFPNADVLYLWRPFGVSEFPATHGADEPTTQLRVSAYQDNIELSSQEAKRARLDLLFYHDLWDRQHYEKLDIPSRYLPLAVNLKLFKNSSNNQAQRPIPVLLTGTILNSVYPLRTTFYEMIKKGLIPGEVRKQFSYRMDNLAAVKREQTSYARHLCQARIALVTTSSKIPLTFRKYFEAMAAGCVLVGDMPACPPPEVKEAINEVSRGMPVAEIAGVVRRLLASPAECERQRTRNIEYAKRYSYELFAERWYQAVKEMLDARTRSS